MLSSKSSLLSPTLQEPEGFRVKASKGEVVVFYFEPLVTQDLKFSGQPAEMRVIPEMASTTPIS